MNAADLFVSDTALAGLLLDVLLKATLLLALSLAMVHLYGRAQAVQRLRLLLIALIGVVTLPLLGGLLPGWSLPVVPDPLGRSASRTEAAAAVSPGEQTAGEKGAVSPTATGSSQASRLFSPRASAPGSVDSTPLKSALVDLRPPAPPTVWSRIAPSAPFAIALIWCLGAMVSLLRQRGAHLRVRRLEREARVELDEGALEALDDASSRIRISRPVQLLTSPSVSSPTTWGHQYPVVMLPADHLDWSAERRRVVLHHELVHVRRNDWLVRVLARAACALYWFHPMAWMTLARLVEEQERACDEQVLALGTRASSYAHHLLALARRDESADAPPIPLPALPMARRTQLEVRLMSILRVTNSRSPVRRAALALPALVLLTGLVPVLATVEPWMQQTTEPRVAATATSESLASEAQSSQTQASSETARTAQTSGTAQARATAATREQAVEQLTAVALELRELERELEPYEVRLEEIEAELEPTEVQLEQVEVSLEPFEARLEELELELEPIELELEALEARLEPHEGRLEEVEAGLEPYEGRLEQIEAGLEPYEVELAALESRLEPFEARMEEAEAGYRAEAQVLEAQLQEFEALQELRELDESERRDLEHRLEDLNSQLEPFHRQMEAIQAEMKPVMEEMRKIHREMEPVHAQMQEVHQDMEPTFERMREVHTEMEPVFAEMRALQEQMAPVHERMRDVHQEMEPVMERMRDIQVDMEPVHERMREVHGEMETVLTEMNSLSERLERTSRLYIEAALREGLAPLDVSDAAIEATSEAVRRSVHLNLNNNRLRLRGSVPEVSDLIEDTLREHGVTSPGLAEASGRAAQAVLDLDAEID